MNVPIKKIPARKFAGNEEISNFSERQWINYKLQEWSVFADAAHDRDVKAQLLCLSVKGMNPKLFIAGWRAKIAKFRRDAI